MLKEIKAELVGINMKRLAVGSALVLTPLWLFLLFAAVVGFLGSALKVLVGFVVLGGGFWILLACIEAGLKTLDEAFK